MTTNQMPVESSPLLLRVEEAARLLSLSRATVYDMLAKKVLPSVKYGKVRRIPLEALKAWITTNTVGG